VSDENEQATGVCGSVAGLQSHPKPLSYLTTPESSYALSAVKFWLSSGSVLAQFP
jgi:hypothetical protein